MAVTCGMAVANLYYNQPLLADIGRTFHTTAQQVGIISMCTQIGYALGMFLFVPLGDMVERRRMILLLLVAVTVSLVGVATAPNMVWMDVASLAVGITTVVPQMLVPLAAHMATPGERGRVIGQVMSGLLIGILLARTVAGFIGGTWGWRSMYWVAACSMLVLAIVLRFLLPESHPETQLKYRQLMKSIGQLIVEQSTLREASIVGAMLFGAFSVFWTVLAFFIGGPPYHYGSQVAGLFGLVGVVGATAAPVSGRLADKFSAKTVVGIATLITLVSFLTFWLFGYHLWGLLLGVILLDLGVQGAQISNQTRIYSLVPEARNRLNTVFMVTYFIGGSIGSSVGSYAWSLWHWTGVCVVGSLMIVMALLVWGAHRVNFHGSARRI
ncbi:MFS transporter [Alicyclobacillus curvatus]|nr:MFS transporter [Alicyclobacillus curvatus]